MTEKLRDFDRKKPPVSPEAIVLRPGYGAYPIKEELLGFAAHTRVTEHLSDDAVEQELIELAELAQKARKVIEEKRGTFNGIVQREVIRCDQEYMGASVIIRVTYALAYKSKLR